MKILISVDMEGVSGVVKFDHVDSKHKEYERFRRLMTSEANAAIEGALAGGADKIVINDSHGGMTNVLIENLNPAAELISGSVKPLGMMQGLDTDVSAVYLVGYHARAGTGAAVLAHTWSGRVVADVSLNGRMVGETGINAALAGEFGAPIVLVTGDQAVTDEACALLGDIETVAVKESISGTAARCLHPEVAQARIREAAERAVQLEIPPFVLENPITLRLAFRRPVNADMAELVPGSQRVDSRTVEWVGEDMLTVFKVFWTLTALAWTG
jgi:D-amino peptidase